MLQITLTSTDRGASLSATHMQYSATLTHALKKEKHSYHHTQTHTHADHPALHQPGSSCLTGQGMDSVLGRVGGLQALPNPYSLTPGEWLSSVFNSLNNVHSQICAGECTCLAIQTHSISKVHKLPCRSSQVFLSLCSLAQSDVHTDPYRRARHWVRLCVCVVCIVHSFECRNEGVSENKAQKVRRSVMISHTRTTFTSLTLHNPLAATAPLGTPGPMCPPSTHTHHTNGNQAASVSKAGGATDAAASVSKNGAATDAKRRGSKAGVQATPSVPVGLASVDGKAKARGGFRKENLCVSVCVCVPLSLSLYVCVSDLAQI